MHTHPYTSIFVRTFMNIMHLQVSQTLQIKSLTLTLTFDPKPNLKLNYTLNFKTMS